MAKYAVKASSYFNKRKGKGKSGFSGSSKRVHNKSADAGINRAKNNGVLKKFF